MDSKQIELVLTAVGLVLNAGILTGILKVSGQWNTVKERNDILWKAYCTEHQIPFRPVGQPFDSDSSRGV